MDKDINLDEKRLELEEQKLANEVRLKELELEIKRKELEVKLEELKPTRVLKLSSFSPTTIAAIIGLLATGIGFVIQSNVNRQLERDKFQSQLILKAIETGDPEKALANLRFFLQTGLLDDTTGRITIALGKGEEKLESIPVLPPGTARPSYEEARKLFEQALELSSPDASTYLIRGKNYYQLGQYDKAIANLNQAITLDTQMAEAYYFRGKCYEKKGQIDWAKEDCKRAKKLDAKFSDC
ncbi:MAG: tetratricopeptide repeat protein [Blastocatellia bacterium]